MLKTPVTKVSEVPTGPVVELGRHTVTVGLKRLHCTGVSYSTFEEELRSKVVFRFDIAHLHDSQSTSQLLCIIGTHVGWSLWHSSELIAIQEKSQRPAAGTGAHGALFMTNHLQVSLGNDMRRCGESSKHVEKFPRSPLPVSISRWVLCQPSHGSDECHGGHFLPS